MTHLKALLLLFLISLQFVTNLYSQNEKTATNPKEIEFNSAIDILKNATTDSEKRDAISRIQRLANSGYGKALNEIGVYYATGQNGMAKDCNKALEFFKKAWDAKELQAANNLAILYRNGGCMEPDMRKSMEWLRRGADAGYSQSMHDLGLFCLEPQLNEQIDSISALGWFRKAAETGFGPSMYQLARFYVNKGNDEEFRYWIKKGVEQEDMMCLHGYALALGNGSHGFMQNPDEAERYLKKAADMYGFKESAILYASQCIQKKRYVEAIPYLEIAADQGSNRACRDLALIFSMEIDGKKDLARRLMELTDGYEMEATTKEDYNSKLDCGFLLGQAYYLGQGINPPDKTKGLQILQDVANQGHEGAIKFLNSL